MAPFPGPTSTWHNNTYPSLSASRPELSAKGKNVFITGGGSGIGAETAHHFAAAGASRIAIVGRREQPLLDTKASINQKYPGVDVFTTSADMMQKVAVDAVFASFARSGKIDVLISNAGYVGTQDLVHTADAEKYLEAISVNVTQALHVAQAFARHAADNAVVVETNSSAAHVNFASMAYSVGKLAVFRLWDLFAFEFPKMRVYHVQPGVVDTAMNKETGGVKAVGHEDHVSLPASFYLWLASPEANFLKGKFLWANWDVDELKARAAELESSPELTVGLVGWPFGELNWAPTWAS